MADISIGIGIGHYTDFIIDTEGNMGFTQLMPEGERQTILLGEAEVYKFERMIRNMQALKVHMPLSA